jgi:hypothetical protein
VCRSKHVELSINFGIINSITKPHLVGISTESSTMHGSMNIKDRQIFEKYSVLTVCSLSAPCDVSAERAAFMR